MEKLSYEDFMKLSNKEKRIRYKKMNDHDRFRARVTQALGMPKPIGYVELTKEQNIKGKKMTEEIMKMIEISRKSND